MTRGLVLLALSAPLALGASERDLSSRRLMSPRELQTSVLAKLRYDHDYFEGLLALSAEGRPSSRLSPAEHAEELKRAELYLPFLARHVGEAAAYARGQPFTMPPDDERFRVYLNLTAMLNMLQAFERRDYATASTFGDRVVAHGTAQLGVVRAAGGDYYLNLFREFFYTMAVTCYRLGRDADAVRWFARIDADRNLAKLRDDVRTEADARREERTERLEQLRVRPVAVVPFEVPAGAPELAWLRAGLAEVLSADLARHTDLRILEREQLEGVLTEAKLAEMGLTTPRGLARLGELLQAGTVLAGSVVGTPDALTFTVKLVDPATGEILDGATGPGTAEEPFSQVRALALEVLERLAFVHPSAGDALRAGRVPAPGTVRDLLQARLLLATQGSSDEARRLFEQAMADDPAYASLFADLRATYADVTASVAVLPFLDITGDPRQAWMVAGVSEVLATELVKLDFSVVERSQLQAMLEQLSVGELIAPEEARELGRKANADFTLVGSILRQPALLRIDARFVDVRTGTVLLSSSASDSKGDLPRVLTALVVDLARQLHRPLDDARRKELSTMKVSPEEFENQARRRLAEDALARSLAPAPSAIASADAPTRWSAWAAAVAAGSAVVGGVFGWQAYSAVGAAASAPTIADQQAAGAGARGAALGANVSFAVAGVALAAAAVLFQTEPTGDSAGR